MAPAAYDVPLPSAAVFHPPKVNPVLSRVPELVARVVLADVLVAVVAAGTVPLVFPFPL